MKMQVRVGLLLEIARSLLWLVKCVDDEKLVADSRQ